MVYYSLMSTKIIKIPISTELHQAIDKGYATPNKQRDLRLGIIQQAKVICKNATKMVFARKIPCNVDKVTNLTRQTVQEEYPLSEFDLGSYIPYTVENPEWLPKELAGEKEIKYFELQVRGDTYDQLKLGARVLCARIEKFNKSLVMTEEEKTKLNDEQKEKFELARKLKTSKMFVCIEEFLYEQFYGPLSETVLAKIDTDIDEGFNEIYPETKEETKLITPSVHSAR